MEFSPQTELLLTDWFRRVRESQRTHYECGNHYARLNRILGIPTIVLSAVVGTAVFSTIDEQASGRTKLILGMGSIAAAVLASLQTFMSFAERADRHRVTGSQYGSVRRSLEMLKTFPPKSEEELIQRLEDVRKAMDDLAANAPPVPSRVKNRIDRELKSREHRRIFTVPAVASLVDEKNAGRRD